MIAAATEPAPVWLLFVIVVGFLVARGSPDPEGVAGDVFLDVVTSIRRFEGDRRGFVAWVMTIARRRMIDARRRGQRRPE